MFPQVIQETSVRRGGISNHNSIGHSLGNMTAKIYRNRVMWVEVIVERGALTSHHSTHSAQQCTGRKLGNQWPSEDWEKRSARARS